MNKKLIRKMQTAAGGPIGKFLGKSLKEVDEINNYNRNRAKGLFKGIISGKVLPTMNNIGSMLGAIYNGWIDPETTLITGEAPTPGMKNPKLILHGILKAKTIAQRAAKISDKIFDKQYFKALNSKNPQRVKAVRDLHFKGKGTNNQINKQLYHGTPEVFNEFKITDTADPIFHTTETKEVASKIAGSKGRVLNLFGYSKNPLRISDLGIVWHPSNIARELKVQLPRDKVRYPLELYERELLYKLNNNKTYREEANRSFMEKELKGDSYVYKNEVEGGGDSYAFPTSRQLKLSNSITYDDSGNIIPISKRDNFLNNDIRYKQGGKMNILEFLKNGSGIHIKKENRGKFTDYCGGKVTSECIAKGKRSSNPAIRKRATFAANARKWKHQQGGIMDYLTWSNMSVGDLWKYRLNRAKAHLLNPNIENVWEAGKTIFGGNDPENPNMNLMTAPDILPGKINPGFSILKVRSFKFPAITNEVEAVAAKDWMLSLGYRPNPKGNPIKIEANPSNKVIKKEEMFKTNEKHYKLDWLEDREYGVSKSKRKAFKTAEAMESGDARRINSGYTNLKKALLNLVEMNLHKYPQFELKAYEKGLKNIYRRGGDKDALKKYKREFFKRLAGLYGYFKEGGYIQLNLLPIINISDIDAAHNGWEEFSKEFLNKLKEEYLKKKLLELQQVELEGNLFGNFLLTGLGKVFDLIENKKSSDTLPSTSTLSTLPSSNYLSNNLNFGVKSIFGTY